MSNIALSKKSKEIELSLKPLWKLSNFVGDKTLLCDGHRDDGALNLEAENLPQQGNFRALLKYSVFSGNEMLRKHLEVIAAKKYHDYK